MSKASESIQKIQEAARQRVRQRLAKAGNSVTSIAELPQTPIAQTVVLQKSQELKRKLSREVDSILAESFGDLKRSAVDSLDNNTGEVLEEVVPNNCRFITQNDRQGVIILEYPPATRIINCYGHRGQNSLNIPFPYMYFIFTFVKSEGKYSIQQRGIGARTSPLKSKNDIIGILPMPHTQGLHYICQTNANHSNRYDNLEAMASDLVATFWRTQFVHEFMTFTVDKKKIKSWEEWSKLTVLDMLKVKLGAGSSITQLARGIRANDATRGVVQNLIGRAERKMRASVGLFVGQLNLKDDLVDVLESVSSEVAESK